MTEGRPGEARRIRGCLHRQGAVDASEKWWTKRGGGLEIISRS